MLQRRIHETSPFTEASAGEKQKCIRPNNSISWAKECKDQRAAGEIVFRSSKTQQNRCKIHLPTKTTTTNRSGYLQINQQLLSNRLLKNLMEIDGCKNWEGAMNRERRTLWVIPITSWSLMLYKEERIIHTINAPSSFVSLRFIRALGMWMEWILFLCWCETLSNFGCSWCRFIFAARCIDCWRNEFWLNSQKNQYLSRMTVHMTL